MVTLTERDESLLRWLGDVRLADMETVRVMMGALSDSGEPVSLRRAQQRVAKLNEAGLVRRARPTLRSGSVVWATQAVSGKREPNVFAGKTVHDLGVAAVSADLIRQGMRFELDFRPDESGRQQKGTHQTDGVATLPDGQRVLVEVELTPKTTEGRYRRIMGSHVSRLTSGEFAGVWYFCTVPAKRWVERAVTLCTPPSIAPLFEVWATFDGHYEYGETKKARESRAAPLTPSGQDEGAVA